MANSSPSEFRAAVAASGAPPRPRELVGALLRKTREEQGGDIDTIATTDPDDIRKLAQLGGAPSKLPLRSALPDFYLTNPIARASATMGECAGLAKGARAMAAAE